jgi:hypothetical protein
VTTGQLRILIVAVLSLAAAAFELSAADGHNGVVLEAGGDRDDRRTAPTG